MMPAQLRDPAYRFIPLRRGTKTPLVSGEMWQEGAPYSADLDRWLDDPSGGGDAGVRLDRSGLVVIDADTVLEQVAAEDGRSAMMTEFSGWQEFAIWMRERGLELPATFTTTSPGGGSHLPGYHLWFAQRPDWRVLRPRQPSRHCQVKVSGYVRWTDRSAVWSDAPVALLPRDIAEALEPADLLARARDPGERSDYALEGVNNALTSVKGTLMRSWWTQDQADDVVRFANSLLDDPLDSRRLESTVCRPKEGWDRV